MNETTGITPWSHPKAQEWFEVLFDRTGALLSIHDEIFKHGREFELGQVRMFASILILLGRDGIWPRNQQTDLVKIVERLNEVFRRLIADSKPPLTIEEHRLYTIHVAQAEHELEMLRRTVGLSRRMSKLGQPSSWTGFWCK